MEHMTCIVWAVPLLPILGFVFQAFVGRKLPKPLVSLVSCGVVFASFLASCRLFQCVRAEGPVASELGRWISIPGILSASHRLVVDQLTAVMILVVTGIGFLIHLYSIGYMAGDKRYSRYFGYLNLFTGFMLILVMAGNMLLMFVGWEGVGLCSYLLIGFWFEKKANAVAGMKAFIVNRVGDFGFTIGVLTLFVTTGTLDFDGLKAAAPAIPAGVATFAAIMLFVGATGKSAQIPLYVWLPDAMAGPTPVSALIHAATMVTAGVYMVARMNFLFIMSPAAMTVVATVGAATALFAGTVGLAQNDIKKVLAYSTVSQLGFMFMAVGVGAFAAGIFHLFTHAFFKACLFLGSGAVIHGMGGEQDIRKMGGLWKKMPWTFATFAVASLAIAGIPPLAGFFSKDEILWRTFSTEALAVHGWGRVLWGMGAVGALCTAFYMTRLVVKTFLGQPLWKHSEHGDETVMDLGAKFGHGGHHGEPHECPWTMRIALVVLAIGSVAVGFLGVPPALHGHDVFGEWLTPVVGEVFGAGHASHSAEYALMGLSVVLALAGIGAAWWIYRVRSGGPAATFAEENPRLYNLVVDKYRVDEAYQAAVINPLLNLNEAVGTFDNEVIDGAVNGTARGGAGLSKAAGYFDNEVVDGAVNGAGAAAQSAGSRVRGLQTGDIRQYLTFALVGGLVVIALFCIYLSWGGIDRAIRQFMGS